MTNEMGVDRATIEYQKIVFFEAPFYVVNEIYQSFQPGKLESCGIPVMCWRVQNTVYPGLSWYLQG